VNGARRVLLYGLLAGGATLTTVFVYTIASAPRVEIADGVEVNIVGSGWAPTDAFGGQIKLIPMIALKLRNVSEEALPALQVNAIFHRGDEKYEWDNAFRRAAGSDGLAPGGETDHIVMWSNHGYVGGQSPAAMLANRRFVDARVAVFGKYGSTPWVKLGEYPIERTLLRDNGR
jgi:hypothetical protein